MTNRTELHWLNGRYKISAPHNSVSLNILLNSHKPQTEEELEVLIEEHQNNGCWCGAVSKGTVNDFGKNLFQAQFEEWGEPKYSLKECIEFERNLFLKFAIYGKKKEDEAFLFLKQKLPKTIYEIRVADWIGDVEYRIDFEIFLLKRRLCGVQVKPYTFKESPILLKKINLSKHNRYGRPVFYLYYKRNDFINKYFVLTSIINFTNKHYLDILILEKEAK